MQLCGLPHAQRSTPESLNDSRLLSLQLYDIGTMVAVMLLLPYQRLPFFTSAGRRTLTAYIFLQVRASWQYK